MADSIKSLPSVLAKQGEELRELWVMVKDLAQAIARKDLRTWEVYIVDSRGNPGGTVFVDADSKDEAIHLGGVKPNEIGQRSSAKISKALPSVSDPETVGHVGQKRILEKGKKYDENKLKFTGWAGPGVYDSQGHRNPGIDAYNVSDYFRNGVYLGPDMHGVEPTFA